MQICQGEIGGHEDIWCCAIEQLHRYLELTGWLFEQSRPLRGAEFNSPMTQMGRNDLIIHAMIYGKIYGKVFYG
jgi:hypothetical protein